MAEQKHLEIPTIGRIVLFHPKKGDPFFDFGSGAAFSAAIVVESSRGSVQTLAVFCGHVVLLRPCVEHEEFIPDHLRNEGEYWKWPERSEAMTIPIPSFTADYATEKPVSEETASSGPEPITETGEQPSDVPEKSEEAPSEVPANSTEGPGDNAAQ